VSYGRSRDDSHEDELGSLTQSARRTSLRQARIILIVIGTLTVLLNLVFLLRVEKEAKDVIAAEKQKAGPGAQFDEAKIKETEETIVRIARLIYGGTIVLGVIFIILGIAVYAAPVACTVTGLVLYVAGIAIFAAIEPMSLVQGILFKILFTIALVKAVQAALAYEREVKAERAARSRRDEYESGEREEPLNF
jgi:predicted RND superfamily exporter protein